MSSSVLLAAEQFGLVTQRCNAFGPCFKVKKMKLRK
jgi:hypothetical protein